MTEKQRFKVQTRTRYSEEMNKERRKVIVQTIKLGIYSLGIIAGMATMISHDPNTFDSNLGNLSALISGGAGAIAIKNLITSICRKTMFESKIEDINTELEMMGIEEESKGKTR